MPDFVLQSILLIKNLSTKNYMLSQSIQTSVNSMSGRNETEIVRSIVHIFLLSERRSLSKTPPILLHCVQIT